MHHDHLRASSLLLGSVAAGWLGWSGDLLSLSLAAGFPLLWSHARTRAQALTVSATYFMSASRGLPQGVANYYASDIWPGLLLWLIASTGFVLVHTALWTDRSGWRKPLRFLIACVIMAVPPLGILGWAHPITAAGVLFPAWGWWGLLAMTLILLLMTMRHWLIAVIVSAGFWLSSSAIATESAQPALWHGIDLKMGVSLGRDQSLERQGALMAIIHRSVSHHASRTVVVLPESALGFWTPAIARLWQRELSGTAITVIAGTVVVDADGYDNVLVSLNASGSAIVYRQRMPVPGSMWQPWLKALGDRGGARAHFFANPVVDVDQTRIAPLMCYEQLIVWPVIQSMLHDPDLIVAPGNVWWTRGTSMMDIQRASAKAWARLFGKPLIMAFNQ
ncbi:conjugal transfer protein TraB [Agrobacterium albertimagni AOL15]|uniref:Conjugal transfer protein TraB n=1 Tax=Agrobacterium albertimagni AOL15 TaxID=1156935 RepID=K2PKZ1_9HYPH|nr:conjugal transfer protein TraB [Agrobacterium albertimagni]EKF61618.1 conjugal transfer protein TraB [Agrobacterium albertimagni AOL15]